MILRAVFSNRDDIAQAEHSLSEMHGTPGHGINVAQLIHALYTALNTLF